MTGTSKQKKKKAERLQQDVSKVLLKNKEHRHNLNIWEGKQSDKYKNDINLKVH